MNTVKTITRLKMKPKHQLVLTARDQSALDINGGKGIDE